jgi:hypothetical protein
MVSAQLFIHRGVNKGVVVGWPQTRFQPRPISAILGSRCTSLLLRIHNGYQLCSVVICLMFMVILLVLIACIVATRCLLASTSRWPAVLIPQLFAGQKRCVPGMSVAARSCGWAGLCCLQGLCTALVEAHQDHSSTSNDKIWTGQCHGYYTPTYYGMIVISMRMLIS